MSAGLPMWTITQNPSDFPGKFVVRRHVVLPGQVVPDDREWAVTESLEDARAFVPPGLCPLMRDPADDPVIVETWL